MNELEQSWEKVLDLLKPKTTPVSFDTWIDPLTPFRLDRERGTLYLISGDGIGRNLLEDRYKGLIEEAMRETFGVKLNAVFMDSDQMEKKKADKETPFLTPLQTSFTQSKICFFDLCRYKNNYFAHAASLLWQRFLRKNYNPLFPLWGFRPWKDTFNEVITRVWKFIL